MFGCTLLHKIARAVSDPTTKGIIIGSIFTLSGVIIQGIIAYWLECKKHKVAMEVQKVEHEALRIEQARKEKFAYAKDLQQKREKAYRDFVNFYSRILIGLCALTRGKGSIEISGSVIPDAKKDSVVDKPNEQLGPLLGQTSDINTAIRLYGSKEVCGKAIEFISSFLQTEVSRTITHEHVLTLSNILDAIIGVMNEEMHLFEPSQDYPKVNNA